MHRIDREPGIRDQGVQHRVLSCLNRQSDRPMTKALAQRLEPGVKGFSGGRDGTALVRCLALQGEGMLLIPPVLSDQGYIFG